MEYLLKHHEHHEKIKNRFQQHLLGERFVDLTLSCTTGFLKCHQLILSSCSEYFSELLASNPSPKQTIFLRDVDINDLKNLVEFMYAGEVTIPQDRLDNVVRLANDLKVIGLLQTVGPPLPDVGPSDDGNGDDEDEDGDCGPMERTFEDVLNSEESIRHCDTEEVKTPSPKKRKLTSSPDPKISVRKDLVDGKENQQVDSKPELFDPDEIKQENVDLGDDENYDARAEEFGHTKNDIQNDKMQEFSSLALKSVECVIDSSESPSTSSGSETVTTSTRMQGHLQFEHNYTVGENVITLAKLLEPPAEKGSEDQTSQKTATEEPTMVIKPVCTSIEPTSVGTSCISVKPTSFFIDSSSSRNNPPPVVEESGDSRFKAARRDVFNRIRRSEEELLKAAEMVRRGMTFQIASDTYNIPISTIRFYMARRGILPQRRRGRAASGNRDDDSIHPPFEIIHYRLPDIDKLI